jgi:internalin A
MTRIIAGCLLLGWLTLLSGCKEDRSSVGSLHSNDPVAFADTALENAVRAWIQKPEGVISVSDVEGLQSFEASQWHISNLTGMEWFRSLRYLDLSLNSIEDISPLSGMTTLDTVLLDYNPFQDLTVMEDWSALRLISISSVGCSTLLALADKPQLRDIYAGYNQITSGEPIVGCQNLRRLHLTSNPIGSLDFLNELPLLESLDISGTTVTELSAVSNLSQLKSFGCWGSGIEDISPLSNCRRLESLSLWNNQIVDVEPLRQLTSLSYLDISNNQIESIAALSPLTQLSILYADNNSITDIAPLNHRTSLYWLGLSGNSVADITALTTLSGIEYLHLSENPVSDLRPLDQNSGLGEWDQVYLHNTPLSDSSRFYWIPRLEERGVLVYYQ